MANAGGYPRMADPALLPRHDRAELVTALNTLVTVAASCTFPVPEPPNAQTNRGDITVWVNGVKINPSATDGWMYGAGGQPASSSTVRCATRSWPARSAT